MADLVGQQLGNYRLTRLLGQGGFADVYLGEHIHLNTLAAIKVLRTQLMGTDVEQFRNEARTIAHLKHPNIVPILDFGVENNIPYLIMGYASNGTLRQQYPKGALLVPAVILPYVKQVASALQYAHDQKLIHRDIKPENMLVGEHHDVLLSDFGIATVSQSARYQQTQDVVGTVAYMPPEQIQGRPQLASDQYALGVVIYEWLTGTRPFNGNSTEVAIQHLTVPPAPLRQKVPTIPADVEEVVMKALAKEPQQRFLSVRAFATAFEHACTPRAVQPPSRPVGAQFIAPTPSLQQPVMPSAFDPTQVQSPRPNQPSPSSPSLQQPGMSWGFEPTQLQSAPGPAQSSPLQPGVMSAAQSHSLYPPAPGPLPSRLQIRKSFISSRVFVLAAALVAFILIGSLVLSFALNAATKAGKQSSTASPAASSTTGNSATLTPASTSTATPAVTPTSPSPQGTVLYQADWSNGINGWVGSGEWKVLNSQLLNDGSGASSILAPYVPTGPDYAVEARIQVIRVHPAGCSNFGIFVRMTSDSQGGYKAEANCLSTDAPYSGSAEIDTDENLIKADYAPGSDMHTYRVEVQGNHVRFLIDGSLIAETISNRFLSAGRISLIDDSVEIAVSSFTVLTIPVDASAVTPTPTSPPPTGNVLYRANWSAGLNGWVGSGQWKVLNGQLLSDGSGQSSLIAPYVPTGADYAVEAQIQVIRVHSSGCSNFGLLARQTSDNQGYAAQANCLSTDSPYSGSAQINTNTNLAQVTYAPGSDWHTYRIEVKGNRIRFLIDSTVVNDVVDNNFLSAGRIGLTDDSVEIVVASFIVTTV